MSTIAKCGLNGEVSIGNEVVSWEVSINQEAPDATSMDSDGFHEHVGCLRFMDGTMETLVPSGAIGSHLSVQFKNDLETIESDIIITSVDTTDSVSDIVKYKYSFISTGEVTIS